VLPVEVAPARGRGEVADDRRVVDPAAVAPVLLAPEQRRVGAAQQLVGRAGGVEVAQAQRHGQLHAMAQRESAPVERQRAAQPQRGIQTSRQSPLLRGRQPVASAPGDPAPEALHDCLPSSSGFDHR
jgi:hypothetical protein